MGVQDLTDAFFCFELTWRIRSSLERKNPFRNTDISISLGRGILFVTVLLHGDRGDVKVQKANIKRRINKVTDAFAPQERRIMFGKRSCTRVAFTPAKHSS